MAGEGILGQGGLDLGGQAVEAAARVGESGRSALFGKSADAVPGESLFQFQVFFCVCYAVVEAGACRGWPQ